MKPKLIFLSVIVIAFVAVGAVPAGAAPNIQPGVQISMGGSLCTLNWIYDGQGAQAGKVYGGTAGHCVSGPGQRISLTADDTQFGTVVLAPPNLDYALIEVDSEDVPFVNAALKGHPSIPSGVSTEQTAAVGDVMQFSGYGVGFGFTSVTQEQRIGVLGYNDGSQHFIYGAVTFGDSGGPVADVTDGGKAFGIVTTVGAALTPLPQAGEGGVSLDGLLADAASRGFPVTVRTV